MLVLGAWLVGFNIILSSFQHNDSYSATKAEGEALIMNANGSNGLLTCCIRPSSIFGPGDRLLVPSLVAAARAGKSKVAFFFFIYLSRCPLFFSSHVYFPLYLFT